MAHTGLSTNVLVRAGIRAHAKPQAAEPSQGPWQAGARSCSACCSTSGRGGAFWWQPAPAWPRSHSAASAALRASARGSTSTQPWGGYASLQGLRAQRGLHAQPALTPAQALASAAAAEPAGALAGGGLVLLDASNLLYRAHFAFPAGARLATRGGTDTSIMYGFLDALLALLELAPRPTHLAAVFDAAGKNFRHEVYPGYKGQRPPMPAEITAAIPQLRALLEAMAIPVRSVPGVEADDVIGTLTMRAHQAGLPVAIVSPDKDFFQLLRPGVQLLRPPNKRSGHLARVGTFVCYSAAAFREEWGLEPEQFADLLALTGDATDNVPGVEGVGPKTAAPLLARFGDVEGVLANADQAGRQRVREVLASQRGADAARLSKRLVTIKTDMDLPNLRGPLDELALRPPADAGAAAMEAFAQLEFRLHAQRLQAVWRAMGASASGAPDAAAAGSSS